MTKNILVLTSLLDMHSLQSQIIILQAGRSRDRFPMSLHLSIDLILPPALKFSPVTGSASNRNEYQNLPGGKGRPARKIDNLTTISEPII
jgi:hypothetical protein